jgi:hypothetical protein
VRMEGRRQFKQHKHDVRVESNGNTHQKKEKEEEESHRRKSQKRGKPNETSSLPRKEGNFSNVQAVASANLVEADFFKLLPDFKGISDFGVEESFVSVPTLGGSDTCERNYNC